MPAVIRRSAVGSIPKRRSIGYSTRLLNGIRIITNKGLIACICEAVNHAGMVICWPCNTHVEAFKKLAAMNTNEANITPSEAPHAGMFKGGTRNRRDEGGERPYAKKPFRRDEDGEGGRPPFKKKPWQPREGEAANGHARVTDFTQIQV